MASLVNSVKYLITPPIFHKLFKKKKRRRKHFPTHYKAFITLRYQNQTKTSQENYRSVHLWNRPKKSSIKY